MLQKFYKKHTVLGIALRLIKILTTFIIITTTIGTISLVGAYFYFAYDLPNIQTLKDFKPPVVSEVFSDDGTKIGEFWKECRFWLPIGAIPKQVINGFVASEDARFFEHRGVDVLGIGRAMIENLKAGHVVQGGSTITQQITRSILLSSERKFARKIREAILATRIERNLNKEQILELYLNQIFLGNRAYGVKAAARNYFNKTVNELTTAEIAMIAGMPTAPTTDSPVHNIQKARERQEYVLSRMYEHGFITKDQHKEALNQALTVYIAGIDKEYNYNYAPYFTEFVRQMVMDKYGEKGLYEGGLKIYTTVNLSMNQAGQTALRAGLEKLDKRQGYRGVIGTTENIQKFSNDVHKEIVREQSKNVIHIPPLKEEETSITPLEPNKFYKAVIKGFEGNNIVVMVGRKEGVITHNGYKWVRTFNTNSQGYDDADYLHDPKTKFNVGDIILVKLAEKDGDFVVAQKPLVQGALYSMNPHTGEVKAMIGGYDFAESEFNRTTQALRQPGSSFKPFIYSAALDKGFKYTTPIIDGPVVYNVGPYQPQWSPKNYGDKYAGLTTFESDLIHSRNIPTVKIANDIGLHYVTAYTRKMGLTTPIGKYLSMALGSNGVYLNEMVTAYSTFDAGGIKPTPTYVTKIVDVDGNVLEETQTKKEENENEGLEANEEIAGKLKNLNSQLFEEAKKYIQADGLVLSQEELKVLYGEIIPKGHTITPQTAFLMTKLLTEVVDRGTGTVVKALKKPVAGKTGTTNDETDCWFIGFVPDLAAGVWVGFDNIARIGSRETGGHTAAPIFLDFMKEATKDMEAKNFTPPKGLKEERVASMSGGSAVYFRGYSLLREGLESERRIMDRAIDFYEEDMRTETTTSTTIREPGQAPPTPAKNKPTEEDDLAY